MRVLNKVFAGVMAAGVGLAATAAFAGDIRVGITMRMVSENGQAYGQMMMDEIKAINDAGGINGNMIDATLMNDECKSDKGVANANKLIFQEKIHLLIGSTCSSVSLPIVDVTAKAGVPQMIPHSTNSKITQKGSEWVFRIPVSGRYYGGVNAKYVGENIGTKILENTDHDAADNRPRERSETTHHGRGKRLHQHQITHLDLHRLHRADQHPGGRSKTAGKAEDQRNHQRNIDPH